MNETLSCLTWYFASDYHKWKTEVLKRYNLHARRIFDTYMHKMASYAQNERSVKLSNRIKFTHAVNYVTYAHTTLHVWRKRTWEDSQEEDRNREKAEFSNLRVWWDWKLKLSHSFAIFVFTWITRFFWQQWLVGYSYFKLAFNLKLSLFLYCGGPLRCGLLLFP